MVDYELRNFNGFNALIIDCEKCKRSCSLENNECLKCISDLNLKFSLLELKKTNSLVYFDGFLSKKIKSGIFELVPSLVPKFLLYYLIPVSKGEVLQDSEFYSIIKDGNERTIIFNPLEYDLNIKDLERFSNSVLRIQEMEENNASSKVPELSDELLELVSSYTIGLGIFDKILLIPEIQDVFINSPGDSCVFFFHSKYGQLKSNLYLKKEMLNRISTFLRTDSARPFDESFPVIHTNIKGFNVRICGVTYPLTHEGIGFALRKHCSTPLSIARMVHDEFMDSNVAALLWFLIDSDIKLLITGPRGSGKTTLLSSLLFLSNKINRIIIIEDTAELPVPNLKELGFNVEHLRTKSFENADSFEFSNDTALRTALRLGESLLVLGEVRGTEAKFLFEAMRIGASGNNVMGTIHGSNAFDTFDRVVNDLGVPPTSFKATDLVISCSYLNSNNIKGRKLFEITEIKKNWSSNPLKEKGFVNIVSFNPKIRKYSINLENSLLIKSIAFKNGVSLRACKKSINDRKKILDLIIDNYERFNDDVLFSNETIVNISSMIGCNKKLEEISTYINSIFLKGNEDELIVSVLKSLKAYEKVSAIDSKELFNHVNTLSRIKFNELLSSLESKRMIESFVKGHKRYWFIRR
ncbi:MAG: ATPase, T2SS/T4P/T4SS family [Candidatus Nanoarchaeia archaeon]|jgi:type IV secretory pathway ATPase VirB11/archaellum biosynthesis ATPase